MSRHGLDLAPLLYGAGVSLAVAVLGTPAAWRALAAAPRPARILAGNLACIGLAGTVALLLGVASYRLDGVVPTTVLFSAVLQGAAAIIQSLLPRRA